MRLLPVAWKSIKQLQLRHLRDLQMGTQINSSRVPCHATYLALVQVQTSEATVLHEPWSAKVKVHRCFAQINGVSTRVVRLAAHSPHVAQLHHLVVVSVRRGGGGEEQDISIRKILGRRKKETNLIELSDSRTNKSLVASGCHLTESTSKLAFNRNNFSSKLVVLCKRWKRKRDEANEIKNSIEWD